MQPAHDINLNKDKLDGLSKKELIHIIDSLHHSCFIDTDKILKGKLDYRTLLEATSDIIFVIDREGTLIYVNAASKVFFPSWTEQNLGRHYLNIISDTEKERATQVFGEVLQKGTIFENELFRTPDDKGLMVYLTMSLSPIKAETGGIIGMIGIMKNITERHLAEKKAKEYSRILESKIKEQVTQAQELKGLRDFNEDIINHAPIGIFVMDPSGIIMSENPALKKIMGHSTSDTMVGYNLINEPGFPATELGKLYNGCMQGRKTCRAFGILYKTAGGARELIINATIVPVFDARDMVEKTIFMIEDNTQQAAITAQAYETEKLSALGILASGVASELKNCINKMVMDLNFVDNNIGERNPAAEYIDSLHLELGRIKNITEQLMSLSSADEEGKEICDLNKILASHQIDVMLKRLRSEGFKVIVEPSKVTLTVRANQNQLLQILIQFIENAEEAMPDKGTIRITAEEKQAEEGNQAIITVTDTGIGIPEENFNKIFQPFFTTKGSQATGLGLMITSAIVQNLGGTIGLKSKPGEGTSFRIALPVADRSS
jgi:PAS domain S-box-containing protein